MMCFEKLCLIFLIYFFSFQLQVALISLDPAKRNQTTKSTKDKEVSSNKPKVFTS